MNLLLGHKKLIALLDRNEAELIKRNPKKCKKYKDKAKKEMEVCKKKYSKIMVDKLNPYKPILSGNNSGSFAYS